MDGGAGVSDKYGMRNGGKGVQPPCKCGNHCVFSARQLCAFFIFILLFSNILLLRKEHAPMRKVQI